MHLISEISGQWMADLPPLFGSVKAFWIIGGVYGTLLVAGLVIDILMAASLRVNSMEWNRHVKCLKDRTWTWREAGLMAIILLTVQLMTIGVSQLAPSAPQMLQGREWVNGGQSSSWVPLSQGLSFHVMGLVALVWSVRRRKVSWNSAFGIHWSETIQRVGQGMVFYLATLPMVFFASLIYQLILFWFGYPLTIQHVVLFFLEPRSVGMQFFFLGLALLIAPMTEEALFRGIALPLLIRTLGVVPGVLLTSVCFALIHCHVPSFMPLFVLAVAWALAYIYTESLVVPVVMHALFNGMNIGLMLIALSH